MTFLQFCTAWAYPLFLVIVPLLFIRISKNALPHYARFTWSTFLHVVYLYILFVGCGMPVLVMGLTSYNTDPSVRTMRITSPDDTRVSGGGGQSVGLLPYLPGEAPAPLNALHSRGGEWPGRDYVRPCGTAIVAPFDGRVARGGAGAIDGWDNTYMYIKSADGRYDMLIMHSDFYLSVGESFSAGQQIGATNTIGYSSECHEHISLLVDGIEADPEQYRQVTPDTAVAQDVPARDLTALAKALAALGYNGGQGNDGAALRVSHYDPSLGGTNCDSDCSTMASGQKVADWVNGRDGIYAAACPPEWPFGTRFELYGNTYQCQDRGGWIQTRTTGEFDPAMGGFTAKETYHWVDLLDNPPVPYGTLVYDWQFVN